MKYHNLNIDTGTLEKYNKVTEILKVIPENYGTFSTWSYQVATDEEGEYFDFINVFLDLLEPNFGKLKDLGIQKDDIIIWLFYEYDQQCSMSCSPQEMKRLGNSEIALNIDCIQRDK